MMHETAVKLMENYTGGRELLARAAHDVGKGNFHIYYLILPKNVGKRKRWTALDSPNVSNAYWMFATSIVFAHKPKSPPSVEVLHGVDGRLVSITSNDENMFAACALNLSGSQRRPYRNTTIAYLDYTVAWIWHGALCERLDVAMRERAEWRKLWLDTDQSRARQLMIKIHRNPVDENELRPGPKQPTALGIAHQRLLGKALVMLDPDQETPFQCFYLIRRKAERTAVWLPEDQVEDYYLYAYTLLGAHYTGCQVVTARRRHPHYTGYLRTRVSSIERSNYRVALIQVAQSPAGQQDESTQDESESDSDVTDPETAPALGLLYSSYDETSDSDETDAY